METGQRDILAFQAQRAISALCKNFLNIVEDLQEEYDRYFEDNKLGGTGSISDIIQKPPENFLNERHFDHLRKRILDKGGDATRDLLEEFQKYKVRLLTNEELQDQARDTR